MRITLIITRHWFDEIRSGRKIQEFRDMSTRLTRQICDFSGPLGVITFKPVTEIILYNGYNKNRPTMLVECTGIEFFTQDDGYKCFAFNLGKVLKVENC